MLLRTFPCVLAALLCAALLAPATHAHSLPNAAPASGHRAILPPPGGYPPEESYSLALHMHASMSEQSGSMEWHTVRADSFGCDIIWWTEHDWRFTNFRHMNKVTFEEAFWQELFRRWAEPDDQYLGGFRYWGAEDEKLPLLLVSSLSDTLAAQGTKSLRLELSSASPTFVSDHFVQTTSQLNNKYSLTKKPVVSFAIFPQQLDLEKTKFFFEAELSDHPDGTHLLRYVAGSLDEEDPATIPLTLVPGQWNVVTVDLLADALAKYGTIPDDAIRIEDNSFNFARVGLAARDHARAVVFFDDYLITPDPQQQGNVLLDRTRELGAYYEARTPTVKQYFGSEISKFAAQPHLNAYAPNHVLVDYGSHPFTDSLYYAIDQVHAQGGAVSYNHVFGPQFFHTFPETPEQNTARHTFTKRGQIQSRALGVDVFEIGYRLRGAMNLAQHFELWDALTANAVFVTGNGVTDSHGRGLYNLNGWGPSEGGLSMLNNFVTWLYTEELSEAGFVRAMKSGRAYFGDPFRWKGTLDLATTDGFRMGQVVVTDRDAHDLVVTATNVPDGSVIRLLQMEIREHPPQEYLVAHVLRSETLADEISGDEFSSTVTLDVTTPCFVRVELGSADDKEWAFSNPIHFVHDVPDEGVTFGRVAGLWDDLRLFRGDRVTLRDATFNADPRVLTLVVDEEPAGTGTLVFDCGAAGAPDMVQGAANVVFSAGVLTLSGFGGASSTVAIGWGVTASGSGAPAAAAVRLDPARPNPFRRTAVATLHLPEDAVCRVDVIDVTGRVVRTLVNEHSQAGTRALHWNGRDSDGRAVGDGVYFLRAVVGERSLVQKIVKID